MVALSEVIMTMNPQIASNNEIILKIRSFAGGTTDLAYSDAINL